jgi:hypothetical protein
VLRHRLKFAPTEVVASIGHFLHAGDGASFRAWNYRVSEAGLTIIVLSNDGEHDSSWLTALRNAIVKAID